MGRFRGLVCVAEGHFDKTAAACVFTPPLSRSRADDGCERPGQRRLIGKSSLRGYFHQRVIGFGQKALRDFHAAQNQITMRGGPERYPERSRKMTDGKPALLCKR